MGKIGRESLISLTWCNTQLCHPVLKVVPIYAAVSWPNMDWIEYLNLWERLSPDMKRVGEMVGVEERFLIRAMRGTINKQASWLRTINHVRYKSP